MEGTESKQHDVGPLYIFLIRRKNRVTTLLGVFTVRGFEILGDMFVVRASILGEKHIVGASVPAEKLLFGALRSSREKQKANNVVTFVLVDS